MDIVVIRLPKTQKCPCSIWCRHQRSRWQSDAPPFFPPHLVLDACMHHENPLLLSPSSFLNNVLHRCCFLMKRANVWNLSGNCAQRWQTSGRRLESERWGRRDCWRRLWPESRGLRLLKLSFATLSPRYSHLLDVYVILSPVTCGSSFVLGRKMSSILVEGQIRQTTNQQN